MPGRSRRRYIRLKFISGKNLQVPSSEESVVWGDTFTDHHMPHLSHQWRSEHPMNVVESREVIGKLQILWDELLDHGDEPFDISFPPPRLSAITRMVRLPTSAKPANSIMSYCPSVQRAPTFVKLWQTHLMKASAVKQSSLSSVLWGHLLCPTVLDNLSWALSSCFEQHGSVDDLDASLQLRCEAVELCLRAPKDMLAVVTT
ncbi:hypothetical protein BDR07DRAFT_1380252 [Suillus spraguei]|nr:hypothetical protein BDR07DRAFT_1380252 [Suillus spraguei]